ncbi:MAG: excisionase family DNA-binding protein [Bifidobacteriaceae bacterium]|nr:excisionase family DNA-binding protein [Bifidobacteriaceae bacterium]
MIEDYGDAQQGLNVAPLQLSEPSYSPREAAKLLDISWMSVRRAIVDHELAAHKAGHRWQIPAPELQRYRTALMQATAQALGYPAS